MAPIVLLTMLVASIGPAGPDAAREPQLAASGSLVGMTWGAGNGIWFSGSSDSGHTFSAPVKVAEAAVLPLNRHRGPRIAISGKTIVISAVTGRTLSQEPHAHGLPSDGNLVAWRSTDEGRTWSKGSTINDVPEAPTEGLHSLAADQKGVIFAAWLDKRDAGGAQLYGARSEDGGATWSKNVLIYASPEGTICQCCHPSAAIRADGEVYVTWRNCLGGARDMYLAQSHGGLSFSKPEKLGAGSWKLNACPMDGGGLAVSGARVVTAWRREDKIYLDSPGAAEQEIGTGRDVAVAVNGDQILAIWAGQAGIMLWRNGTVEKLADSGSFPAIAATRDGAIAAWESDGRIETRLLTK